MIIKVFGQDDMDRASTILQDGDQLHIMAGIYRKPLRLPDNAVVRNKAIVESRGNTLVITERKHVAS